MNTAMYIVKARFPEGSRPTVLRQLNQDEFSSLVEAFADAGNGGDDTRAKAARFLATVKSFDGWLMCGCRQENGAGPILFTRTMNGTDPTLCRNTDRAAHAPSCPFYRLQSERDPSSGRSATIMVHGRLGILRQLSESGPSGLVPTTSRVGQSSSQRMPLLGRLLFTILHAAGLDVVPASGLRPFNDQYQLLQKSLSTLHFDKGKSIQVDRFSSTRLSIPSINALSARLKDESTWPDNLRPQGFVIGVAKSITDGKIINSQGDIISIAGSIRQFGQVNTPGPFLTIIIISDRPERQSKWYEPLQAYCHPMFNGRDIIAVDSDLERKTLKKLLDLQSWIRKKNLEPFTIEKPLFDTMVNDEPVRPDFILRTAKGRTVIIETMGFATEAYADRKSRTHPLMETLGSIVEFRDGDDAGNEFGSRVLKALRG